MISVAVYGGRGYVGGELTRLLYQHGNVDRLVVTSESQPGVPVEVNHPPLRGSNITYVRREEASGADVAFLAGPHGSSEELIRASAVGAEKVIDLSADYRLGSMPTMQEYYGWTRAKSESAYTAAIPEVHRKDIADASAVAVPGCMANAAILMLYPLAHEGLASDVHVDARTGSSGAGASGSATHDMHPVRAGSMRVFAPLGHRHEAEINEQLGIPVTMTATSTPQVRGIQTLARVTLPDMTLRDVNDLYHDYYGAEPFVRLLFRPRGPFRYPDPKVLLGSNFCDIAIAADRGNSFLLMAALDNLVKGAAGNAVQAMNIMSGSQEDSGLTFTGLHPL